jgi:hypothetical protein
MFRTEVVEKIKTHFIFHNVFGKSCRLWDNVEKYCRARQATDDNMAHALSVLDTKGYKHTLRILLFFHCNSSYTNELQSYGVLTFPVLIKLALLLFQCPQTFDSSHFSISWWTFACTVPNSLNSSTIKLTVNTPFVLGAWGNVSIYLTYRCVA